MKWDALEEEPCSLARTVAVIGDRWSLLILRECFLRKRRFEAFQASLGITRHLLAERLKKLVRFGVLRRIPYQESPKRYEYILTQKGLDLYPIIMSIVHWGNIHMVDARGRPMLHEHKACEPVAAKGVHVHPGPGARQASPAHAKAKDGRKAKAGAG
jgi:DNA-binding HxlR family transcriptional regulator